MTVTGGVRVSAIGKSPKLIRATSVRPAVCSCRTIWSEQRGLEEKIAVGAIRDLQQRWDDGHHVCAPGHQRRVEGDARLRQSRLVALLAPSRGRDRKRIAGERDPSVPVPDQVPVASRAPPKSSSTTLSAVSLLGCRSMNIIVVRSRHGLR